MITLCIPISENILRSFYTIPLTDEVKNALRDSTEQLRMLVEIPRKVVGHIPARN
jgi:hypothetical protein